MLGTVSSKGEWLGWPMASVGRESGVCLSYEDSAIDGQCTRWQHESPTFARISRGFSKILLKMVVLPPIPTPTAQHRLPPQLGSISDSDTSSAVPAHRKSMTRLYLPPSEWLSHQRLGSRNTQGTLCQRGKASAHSNSLRPS
jgi:hypothetical protein